MSLRASRRRAPRQSLLHRVRREASCAGLHCKASRARRPGTGNRTARRRAVHQGAGPIIVFETVKGSFEIETYPNEAPKTVEHILALVKRNFYNGLRIHRFEPGFVVQWGDPQTRDMTKKDLWGTGGSGKTIGVSEVSPKRPHQTGVGRRGLRARPAQCR